MEQNPPSGGKLRLRSVFFWSLLVVVVLLVLIGYPAFVKWRGEQRVEALKQAVDKMTADAQKEELDNYGGKTPQETLQMYIDAVEKGDYTLASKYFIKNKQDEEVKTLSISSKENIQKLIGYIKEDLKSEGSSSFDGKEFYFEKPLYIHFKQLSSGIWKIIEI